MPRQSIFSKNLLALGVLAACSSAAWAACDYDTSGGSVALLSAGTCTPQYTTYYGPGGAGALGPVFAGAPGAQVTITQNTQATNTRGGGNGGTFYAMNGASGVPAIVTSPAGITLTSDTTATPTNTHGFRATNFGEVNIQGDAMGTVRSNQGRAMIVGTNGSITVDGTTQLTVAATAGQNSRALALEGAANATGLTARIELKGNVTATLLNDSARGVNAADAGTLIIGGHFTVNGYAGKTGNDAIRTAAGPIDVQLGTFTFSEPGAIGILMAGNGNDGQPTTIIATGQGNINSALDGFVAIRAQDPEGTLTLGPGSQFNMTGANAVGVELRTDAQFAAGDGLTINADPAVYDSQTAFNFVGADQPVVLGNANIQTRTLWRSTDPTTNETFTANSGYYRGVADIQAGTLALNLDQAARWDMIGDAELGATGNAMLAGGAVLDASIQGGAVALGGDLVNNGGIVTLQQVGGSPVDALGVRQYSANGGELWLNTTLNAGDAASESDVLRADSVVASGEPTAIRIATTATSAGVATTGKGILVVEVTGGAAASADNAFKLAAPVWDNGFLYELAHESADGNWYLRSRAAPNPNEVTPVPTLGSWGLLLLGGLLAGFAARRKLPL